MDPFEQHRPWLLSIAYRMLGTVVEAEDVVQEAYLRYQAANRDNIREPRAFLTTVTTRLCLDVLKSARAQRETYYGPWLPEPFLTEEDSPASQVGKLESLSVAFLLLLEQLSPTERAVFLLREVFDYNYAEVADIVGKDEATCRQLLHRARQHLHSNRPRFTASPDAQRHLLEQFLLVTQAGDLNGLTALLRDDIEIWSDGGGKVTAAPRPVQGRDKVAKVFLGIARTAPPGLQVEIAHVNGGPAALFWLADGQPYAVISLDIEGEQIARIHILVNPDKLTRLKRD
jgi:RNA polymerase sigma-70 factor (ECF subfamily)